MTVQTRTVEQTAAKATAETAVETAAVTTATPAAATTAAKAVEPGAAAGKRLVGAGRAATAVNRAVGWLTRHGVSLAGSRILAVRGRKSGQWRTTPVNPLTRADDLYLVAPRGHTQWVRNLRATDGGELRLGKRVEAFTYVELADHEKPDVLRAYIKRWKWEVGVFFDGVDADATDEELLRIAPGYPVFRIRTQG